MCLIVFAWRPGHAQPLVVAANRDEFHRRPSLPLAAWSDAPDIFGGRDLQLGGTWFGISGSGRFAAITNIRDPHQPLGELSRGTLTEAFLRSAQSPLEYLEEVAARRQQYTGFNLLVGDAAELAYLNSREGRVRSVEPGIHGLSNAHMDTSWPKLVKAREAFAECLAEPQPEALLAILADRSRPVDAELPDTGVPLEWERLLSSIFIRSPDYGTRASSVLIRQASGAQTLVERSFDADGEITGEVTLVLDGPAPAPGALSSAGCRSG